jgi:asparagine synthase (glutamine-hydrolysing)
MPGFLGIINNNNINNDFENLEMPFEFYTPVVCDCRTGKNFYFKRFVIPKFLNDKIFDENERLFVCTDGILLNSKKLRGKYHSDTNFSLIDYIYSNNGINGISEIKGDFSGFIFDKKTKFLHIFTNHIGSKPVFYFFDKEKQELFFGSDLRILVYAMRKRGYSIQLSETGAYCLLTIGYMIGDNTIIKNIKKIPPGSILTFSEGDIKIDQYYKIVSTPYVTDSEEIIIKKLHSLFVDAIKLEYDKDLEYNYSHIVTLSGGLDSRMNAMYAKKFGYSNILCLCFSESNYLDEMISKKIASDHGFDYIFRALDNGNYRKNIDETAFVNGALVFYSGAAHQHSTLKLLEWKNLGLLHTGEVGDLVMGSFLKDKKHNPVNIDALKQIANSTKLIDEKLFNTLCFIGNYENSEIFTFYERVVNGTFNGFRVTEQFTEFSSPFLDKDFLEYAMRIPPEYRYKEEIYQKWIISELPEASEYPWEKIGVKITAGRFTRSLFQVFLLLKKIYQGKNFKHSMNPSDYWYRTNPSLREYLENYFNDNINLVCDNPSLLNDVTKLFKEGNMGEKSQALTLLAAIKLYSL